ncbi:MAG: Nif3-like dinuclear metal center hexameric protein [Gammaproteobacteria bacterium]|nr:MAG: Nif3-like dinuclear metal center hexameric protein [Gammaproteobacteria bacterium]
MITRTDLLSYLETILEPDRFQDYCPNGLQVAGSDNIKCLITGVTASKDLLDAAIAFNADTILVHHGYFWCGEDPRIIGIKQQRLKQLLLNDVNLLAYHLPIDAHPIYGNNVQLAQRLEIAINGLISDTGQPALAMHGNLLNSCSADNFAIHISDKLGREPLLIQGHERPIKTVGWCSGAAQTYIEQAAAIGLDAFISGEISEQTVHLARELGINYFAAGHHATERYGVMALGKHLAEKFNLEYHFIDMNNPV